MYCKTNKRNVSPNCAHYNPKYFLVQNKNPSFSFSGVTPRNNNLARTKLKIDNMFPEESNKLKLKTDIQNQDMISNSASLLLKQGVSFDKNSPRKVHFKNLSSQHSPLNFSSVCSYYKRLIGFNLQKSLGRIGDMFKCNMTPSIYNPNFDKFMVPNLTKIGIPFQKMKKRDEIISLRKEKYLNRNTLLDSKKSFDFHRILTPNFSKKMPRDNSELPSFMNGINTRSSIILLNNKMLKINQYKEVDGCRFNYSSFKPSGIITSLKNKEIQKKNKYRTWNPRINYIKSNQIGKSYIK